MGRQLAIGDITTPEEAAEVLISVYGEKASETAYSRLLNADDSATAQFWEQTKNIIGESRS